MIDLNLLRICKHRKEFFRLQGRIPRASMDPQTNHILDDFKVYFDRMPDADVVDMKTFLPIFRARHTSLKDDQVTAYEGIFNSVSQDVQDDARSAVMMSMLELRMGTDVAKLLTEWEQGDIENIHAELSKINDEFLLDADIRVLDYIKTDIMDLLNEESDESGIKSRLSCLQEAMRGYRGGDFGIVAGRPDKGKTTFLASEATYWAPQLPDEKNIVWLNNEGPGKRIIPRLYQAALGMTVSEMRKVPDLRAAYIAAVGRIDKIRIVDIHGLDNYAVENIIRANAAGVVIYDMIDHIRGFGSESRTDLQLEEMYKWGREIAVKYDLVGVATSQISNEGDGLQFPTLGMLKDSKTGKQGACDFQMMIGAVNDPNMSGLRYIGLPKNKLRREGFGGDPRATVSFKPQIARFEDVPIASDVLD